MFGLTVQQIIFIVVSLVTLISAWVVVTSRNLFHAALALMASFLGVAGYYVLLDAGFLAAAQLLVYIGAISILIIFAIMMTRRLMQTTESPFNSQHIWGALGSILAFVLLVWVIGAVFWDQPGLESAPQTDPVILNDMTSSLGALLTSSDGLVIPFIVVSILLLAALIGSIVIARPERE